jgi:hypothetical protein
MAKDAPVLAAATSPTQPNPPAFVILSGDLDHRGPGADNLGGAASWLTGMRTMHRDLRAPLDAGGTGFGTEFYDGLIAGPTQLPLYYVWDDHDYCVNNADTGCAARPQAIQAYDEYFVFSREPGAAPSAAQRGGVWQRLAYGKDLDVFMLDARSNRDLTTVPPTMLGATQLNWLVNGLTTSTAAIKLIVSPVPFNATTKAWDAWGYFPEERAAFLAAIQGVAGVVIVSGDIHSGGAVEFGGPGGHSELPEISTPHANMPNTWVDTWDSPREGDLQPKWSLGQPDGKPLSGISSPGYVHVQVHGRNALFTVRDAGGNVRTTADGTPLQYQTNN